MNDPRVQAHVGDAIQVVTFLGVGYIVSFIIILILYCIMQAKNSHGFEYGGIQWGSIALRASFLFAFVWVSLRTISNTLDMGELLSFVPTFPFESLFYNARYNAQQEAYKQHLMKKYYKKDKQNLGHPDLFEVQTPVQSPPPGFENLASGSPEQALQVNPGNPYILLGGGQGAKNKKVMKDPNAVLPDPLLKPNYKQAAVDKLKDAALGAYAAAVKVAKKGPGGRNSHIGKGKGGKYGYGFKKNGKPAKKPGRPPKGKEKKKKKQKIRRSSD